jgi:hypothetical protein
MASHTELHVGRAIVATSTAQLAQVLKSGVYTNYGIVGEMAIS